jgi:hypothetical protein
MRVLAGCDVFQKADPAERAQHLVPDYAGNPVVYICRIRLSEEHFPQDAAGHAARRFDVQQVEEQAPVFELRFRQPRRRGVIDLEQVEGRDAVKEIAGRPNHRPARFCEPTGQLFVPDEFQLQKHEV